MKFSSNNERLKHFPITMFAIVMGMGGFTIMYQKAHDFLNFPQVLSMLFGAITTLLFVAISIVYICKFFCYPQIVKNEFSHPIKINFFASISISMLMLAAIYIHINEVISMIFWYFGAILHFILTLYTISFWINHNQEINNSNPAWFIPVVGNVLIPIGGADFVNHEILMYFFSVGIFFWVILLAILLNRIIFHNQLPEKFMPTMFILIAPPAVGLIAYVKMFGNVDIFAMFLFNIALFFTFLLGFMYKNFTKIKFFISWWAFIFPLSAMTISSMIIYNSSKDIFLLIFSYFMLTVTTIVICIVAYQTISHIKKREICIEE